jgi:drug/metabolite transporter (DMT)-like permease
MAANILIRHLSVRLPPLEMAFFRAAGGVFLALVAWRAFLHVQQLRDPRWHLIRAGVGAVSLVALVHAYSALPVALVAGVMYTRLLLVIPMQRVVLGEGADWRVWAAASVGMGGALLALWPRLLAIGMPDWNWGVASLVVAALAGAGSQICMRRLARSNPASVVVAVSAILISALIAAPASLVAVAPPVADAPWLLGLALLSALAQWATVRGYAHASPAVLMPVTLIDLPLALVGGYLLFGEVPTGHAAFGSALVVAAAFQIARFGRDHSESQR